MGKGGAFQANLGVWGGGGIVGRYKQFRGLAGSLDYLYEMPRMARVKNAFELAWSMGFGAGVGAVDFSDGPLVAGAFVLGLEFLISPVPMDVVIEYRPSILLVPKIGYDMLDFTGQVRWYF